MKELQHTVQEMLSKPEWAEAWKTLTGGTPEECPPIYSFDNPSIHRNDHAHLRELGLMAADSTKATDAWLELPPYSGDLHRTIERVHARICGEFQRQLEDESCKRSMQFYCERLAKIFYETQTTVTVSECLASISSLYEHVVAKQGAKAERPYC